MSDDLANRGPQERSRISVSEEHAVRYWTQTLGVPKRQLAATVQAVGSSADRARARLGQALTRSRS